MSVRFYAALLLTGVACLGGCTSYVDAFKDRLIAQNIQAHDMVNEQTLLNIVRASRYEVLNFIALSKTTNTRQQTLGFGIPAITVGPGRTLAQRNFTFTGNSESNQIVGAVEANPLASVNFQQGMMMPVSTRQLAMLIAAHGREAVLLATIEEIHVTDTVWKMPIPEGADRITDAQRTALQENSSKFIPQVTTHVFRNDPSNNQIDGSSENCSADQFLPKDSSAFGDDSAYANAALDKLTPKNPDNPWALGEMRNCSFARFRALLTALLQVGLTVDVPYSDKTPDSNQSADDKKSAPPPPAGNFCLNEALINPQIKMVRAPTLWEGIARCGYNPSQAEMSRRIPSFRGKNLKEHVEWWAVSEVTFRVRSTLAMYYFMGEVMRHYNGKIGPDGLFEYTTDDAKSYFGLHERKPYFTASTDNDDDCAVSVSDGGQDYCVKRDDASTLNLLAMLQDLQNLNTNASDLNASFTVRALSQ